MMTPKDKALIKSALRRAFARSDLHKEVEDAHRVEHSDPDSPRCKKWSWCGNCGQVVKSWKTQVDHILPVVPLNKTLDDMSIEEIAHRIFCDRSNLWVLDLTCHENKTTLERAQRPKRKRKEK